MAALDGLASIQLQGSLASGQAVRNTFHISNAASGSAPDYTELLQLATDINTWLGTQYRGVLTTADSFVGVLAKQVLDPTVPDTAIEAFLSVAAAGTRTLTAPASPQSACALLQLKTPNASRRFRGHMFLPPAKVAGDINGDVWSSAGPYSTAVDALRDKLQAGCAPTPTWTGTALHSYTLSIWSRTAALAAAPSVASVQQVASSRTIRWLRSRERGTS